MTDTLKDIIDALSLYSSEYLIPDYLAETPDYRSHCNAASRKHAVLQELLTPEGRKLLDEFSAARDNSLFIELEANFRAGLVIGMHLSRL